jgi:radical SAM protein with 4Fe4S-binding SPASM domain
VEARKAPEVHRKRSAVTNLMEGGEGVMLKNDYPGLSLDFQIHLTDECNLRCRHCYNKNTATYLSPDQFDYILNQVLKYMAFLGGTPGRASFCGGEPTLSPILLDSMKKCSRAGFRRIGLLTNGVLITDDLARKLMRNGCNEVQICIEGNRKTHNDIRGGTWNQVLKAWEICRRNGMQVFNQTTVNPLNYTQIDDVVEACKGKVHHTRFLRQIPHNDRIEVLTAAQWLEVMERIAYGYCHSGPEYRDFVRVKDVYWSRIFRSMPYRCPFNTQEYPLLPTIECNGDVYVCRRSNIVIGNIFQDNLKNIFGNSSILRRTWSKVDLNSRCTNCDQKDLCGGCRGMALAVNGGIMEEDPHCVDGNLPKPWISDLMEAVRISPECFAVNADLSVSLQEVLDYLRVTGRFTRALHEVAARKITAEAATRDGITFSRKDLQKRADEFCLALGLNKAGDTNRWLDLMGLSHEILEEHLRTELLVNKFKENLLERADSEKLLSSPPIQESVKEITYREWLKQLLG